MTASDKPADSPKNMKDLYRLYGAAMVAVITTDKLGDQHTGSAFHIGDGVFVTARHVVEGQSCWHIEIDTFRVMTLAPGILFEDDHQSFAHETNALFHPDPMQDVAVFREPKLATLPAIPLGGHLDDWINDHDFVLNEVLVLGFPPIPLSRGPVLVAAGGQVNAVIDQVSRKHPNFIISVMARGGFSGGVVLSEWNFALGLVTESLIKNDAPAELGYLTVLTVEPILECLAANRLLPSELFEQWGDLFNDQGIDRSHPMQADLDQKPMGYFEPGDSAPDIG